MANSVWDSDFGSIFRQRYNRTVIEKYDADVKKSEALRKAGNTEPVVTGLAALAGDSIAGPLGAGVAAAGANKLMQSKDGLNKEDDGDVTEKVLETDETVEPNTSGMPTQKSLHKAINSLNTFMAKAQPRVKHVTSTKNGVFPTKGKPNAKHIKGA